MKFDRDKHINSTQRLVIHSKPSWIGQNINNDERQKRDDPIVFDVPNTYDVLDWYSGYLRVKVWMLKKDDNTANADANAAAFVPGTFSLIKGIRLTCGSNVIYSISDVTPLTLFKYT